ncbi:MAG: hypothetical protein HZA54_04440 [Planctomycetes bacterium]|nr:hypothetical protein [Planctomycetota bacterium]
MAGAQRGVPLGDAVVHAYRIGPGGSTVFTFNRELYFVGRKATTPTLVFTGEVDQGEWSPDGRFYVFTYRTRVLMLDGEIPGVRDILEFNESNARIVGRAPSGNRVAVASSKPATEANDVFEVSLVSEVVRRVGKVRLDDFPSCAWEEAVRWDLLPGEESLAVSPHE